MLVSLSRRIRLQAFGSISICNFSTYARAKDIIIRADEKRHHVRDDESARTLLARLREGKVLEGVKVKSLQICKRLSQEFISCGDLEGALSVLDAMEEWGVVSDALVCTVLLSRCVSEGGEDRDILTKATRVHTHILNRRIPIDSHLGAAMIRYYTKLGSRSSPNALSQSTLPRQPSNPSEEWDMECNDWLLRKIG